MKVSIVMPAHNEERRIGATLERYLEYFDAVRGQDFDYEIIIVINNSTDRTEEVVRNFQRKNKQVKLFNFEKKGKGFAVTEGFRIALGGNSDQVGFVDADLATPPEEYHKLILETIKADGAIANRYLKGSEITPRYSFRRSIVSKVFNLIVRSLFFFNYRDTQCGAKNFRREHLEKILPYLGMTTWAFDIELLYYARKFNLRLADVPTKWRHVDGGTLDVKKASIQMLFAVVQFRIINSKGSRLLKPFKPVREILWRVLIK